MRKLNLLLLMLAWPVAAFGGDSQTPLEYCRGLHVRHLGLGILAGLREVGDHVLHRFYFRPYLWIYRFHYCT